MPTAADYMWFDDDRNELVNGFGIFWVKALTPEQAITRAGGTVIGRVDWDGLIDGSGASRPDRWFVGAVEFGGWTFILEITGFAAVGQELVVQLSKGTTAISQFLNVELDDNYRLAEDGNVRLDFAPWDPTDRQGSAPDSLVSVMQQVGFDFSEDLDPADPNYKPKYPTEAAFALTEYLTGVGLTLELLRSQTYLLAEVSAR